jgi:hypothetical protein
MDRPLGDEATPDTSGVGTLHVPRQEPPEAGAGPPDQAPEAPPPADPVAPRYPVHRLRDLDRRGRAWAAVIAAALLLAPILAFAWAAPDWTPANDPALMGLRVLDVGGSRTPLTGQPSTSSHYIGTDQNVDHPGPLHFYVMAPFVRTMGIAVGMVFTSVLIVGSIVLVSAWAVFRQLGRTAGLVAAAALGTITFTTGASSLIDPTSSNIAGYPVLGSIVLLWCLLCGDYRLLPLATAVVTFAAQQHLSALPTLAVATGLLVTASAVGWFLSRRRAAAADEDADGAAAAERRIVAEPRQLAVWGGASAVLGLVLWSPVLAQQVFDRPGNITMMAEFASHGDRESVGAGVAARQLAHALGLPAILGRRELTGADLIVLPSTGTWVSAAVVVGLLAVLAWTWRRTHPRRLYLVAAAGVVGLGGFVNGASVPDSLEAYRLVFYHWVFPLQLLVVTALGLGVADLARRFLPAAARRAALPVAATAVVAVIAVPAVVNPSLDRITNTLPYAHSPIARQPVEDLVRGIREHRDELGDDTILLSRGNVGFDGLAEATAVFLADEGVDLRMSRMSLHFVDDERLADRDTVDAGVLIVSDYGTGVGDPPGELIAEARVLGDLDTEAYDALVAAVNEAERPGFGPDVADAFPDVPAEVFTQLEEDPTGVDIEELLTTLPPEGVDQLADVLAAMNMREQPERSLLDPNVMRVLDEYPVLAPDLDQDLVDRLVTSLPEGWDGSTPLRILAYLLDREEVLAFASPVEL